ncbi:MAG: hypothetical protein OXI63_24590 [Candidatus Poribacteria bacterium]|nr:hypothetical protein [Candidatus Poribacteria bacterium]
MLNSSGASASTGTRQSWWFLLMTIFTVGIALAFVGCGSDETEEALTLEEAVLDIEGYQVVVLQGNLTARDDSELSERIADIKLSLKDENLTAYARQELNGDLNQLSYERQLRSLLSESDSPNWHLSETYEYLLRGAVFVKAGAILTIEPGVKIYGEQATNGTLIIAQGSKIMAEGTESDPIVMSSDAFEGSRARGQWGGLIINGNAPTNQGVTFGEGDTGAFGGNDPTDSSGILRYVRIQYAGIELSPDNELNGISFQGVGSGTIVDHVQVHMNQDDGIEMFGGTVNLKYILVTGARDDSFDWTDGWTGKGQFWVAQQYGDDADNGFEVDNSSKDNEATPRSAATIFNVTLVGDPSGPESDNGMLIREGAAGMYANFIVTGFNKVGLDINNEATHAQADSGKLVVKNGIFFENGKGNFGDEKDDDGFDEAAFASKNGNKETDPNLADPFNKSTPNFTPGAGANAVSPTPPPADGFFDPADFIGGVSPSDNWTTGWTTSAQK